MFRLGPTELLALSALFAVFVLPLVVLVAWSLLRGRKKPDAKT